MAAIDLFALKRYAETLQAIDCHDPELATLVKCLIVPALEEMAARINEMESSRGVG